MTWLNSSWYFSDLVSLVEPAVTGITSLLNNPYFYGIIIVLLILSLVPWTDD